MKVFKFGGASVKDAQGVRNVSKILSLYKGQKLGVVISAMGKTTNAMEGIVQALWDRNQSLFVERVNERRQFHLGIIEELFSNTKAITHEIEEIFHYLIESYESSLPDNYDFEYDQIVSIGEILSTKIITAYLDHSGHNVQWADARKLVRTNNKYREGEVNWSKTELLFNSNFISMFENADTLITQGFVGHTSEGLTTTLGREGSDFSAGIMAFCCNAESVTIWKDVPGMLNADPKYFDNTIKLDKISFREAIELSYYGASVIHPKTIKPLQNKGIPLYVKSFVDPTSEGTVIQSEMDSDHLTPSFIFKHNQALFSITPKDFSFIVEKNLSDIFERLALANAKINVMQNSALNFNILLDEDKIDVQEILAVFKDSYDVRYNGGLELVTIRHYDEPTLDLVTRNKEVLLEQKTRQTARLVVKQK